ncbi:MAG: glycosyltransferase family 2 protein [Solirubrobacterales bacterium]|nr:glycosyltransferase family 2 protein [Solirubrobacterales bacterium]
MRPTELDSGIPDLSVLVVTYNGREKALATLRCALAAAGAADVEWIVVDNGSKDGTPDAIEDAFPQVRVIRSENRGFAAGNNVGLRLARGRYVLLLNPDVEVTHGNLTELIEAMDNRPEVGLASVIQRAADGNLQPSIRRFPSFLRDVGEALFAARWRVLTTMQELETRPGSYEREHSVDWLVGAFLIARREAIEQVGPMDDGFFLYSEEVDWCYRFRQAGWDVRHLPLMTVIHHCGRHDRGDLMPQLAYSRKRFAQKHFGRVKSTQIRTALVLGHLVRMSVLVPLAIRRAPERARFRAEGRALAVQLGMAEPPFGRGSSSPRAAIEQSASA